MACSQGLSRREWGSPTCRPSPTASILNQPPRDVYLYLSVKTRVVNLRAVRSAKARRRGEYSHHIIAESGIVNFVEGGAPTCEPSTTPGVNQV